MYSVRYPRDGEFCLYSTGELCSHPERSGGARFYLTDLPFTYQVYWGVFKPPETVTLSSPLLTQDS